MPVRQLVLCFCHYALVLRALTSALRDLIVYVSDNQIFESWGAWGAQNGGGGFLRGFSYYARFPWTEPSRYKRANCISFCWQGESSTFHQYFLVRTSDLVYYRFLFVALSDYSSKNHRSCSASDWIKESWWNWIFTPSFVARRGRLGRHIGLTGRLHNANKVVPLVLRGHPHIILLFTLVWKDLIILFVFCYPP